MYKWKWVTLPLLLSNMLTSNLVTSFTESHVSPIGNLFIRWTRGEVKNIRKSTEPQWLKEILHTDDNVTFQILNVKGDNCFPLPFFDSYYGNLLWKLCQYNNGDVSHVLLLFFPDALNNGSLSHEIKFSRSSNQLMQYNASNSSNIRLASSHTTTSVNYMIRGISGGPFRYNLTFTVGQLPGQFATGDIPKTVPRGNTSPELDPSYIVLITCLLKIHGLIYAVLNMDFFKVLY